MRLRSSSIDSRLGRKLRCIEKMNCKHGEREQHSAALFLFAIQLWATPFAVFINRQKIQQARTTAISSGGKRSISTMLITSTPAAASAPMKANRHSKNLSRAMSSLRRPARSGQVWAYWIWVASTSSLPARELGAADAVPPGLSGTWSGLVKNSSTMVPTSSSLSSNAPLPKPRRAASSNAV